MVLIKAIADNIEGLRKHLTEVRRLVYDNSSSDFYLALLKMISSTLDGRNRRFLFPLIRLLQYTIILPRLIIATISIYFFNQYPIIKTSSLSALLWFEAKEHLPNETAST